MYGGLDDDEYDVWCRSALYPSVLSNQTALVGDLTGRLPWELHKLKEMIDKANANDVDAAHTVVERYIVSMELIVNAHLSKFYSDHIVGNSAKVNDHVHLMSTTLVHRDCILALRNDLYDHRYFYYRDNHVHPVSGIVRNAMAGTLMALNEQALLQQISYWSSAVRDERNNPIVKVCVSSSCRVTPRGLRMSTGCCTI